MDAWNLSTMIFTEICRITVCSFEILTVLDAYLAALELDTSAADIPYRILPFLVKAKYDKNMLEPLKVSYALRNENRR